MFYALIRKELRLHRLAILAAIAVALVAEAILPAMNYALRLHREPNMAWSRQQREFAQALYEGSGVALITACLFGAVFGGASTAIERRERWIDLVATLPVTRTRRIVAAAVVGSALTMLMFAFHATILIAIDFYGVRAMGGSSTGHAVNNAAMTIGTFGVARLLATWMRSPSLLVAIACGTLTAGFMLAIFVNDTQPHEQMRPWIDYVGRYLAGVAIVGALALVASFPIASRRVEP